MRSKSFLLYPLYLLLFLIALDKVFLLPVFHEEFLQAGNSVFYFHRQKLEEKLANDTDRKHKNLALVFGDSRSYPFTEFGIPDSQRPFWTLYNFSAPQAVPMYSYFQFKSILDKGIRPQYILYSLSPEAFDDSKGFLLSPFLRLGCKDGCIETVWTDLPVSAQWNYILDKVFTIRSVELNLSLLSHRFKQNKWKEYKAFYNPEYQLVNMGKGEYLMYATNANPTEKLKNDTVRIASIYMRSYALGTSQLPYVEKFLQLAKENSIPVLILWPKVYPAYYEYYKSFRIESVWWEKIVSIAKKYQMQTMDVNKESACDLFNDASHQSAFCFKEQMKTIWEKYVSPSVKR